MAKPTTIKRRSFLLRVAVFGLGAGLFASCAAEPPRPPLQTVVVRPLPPAPPSAPPRAAPRPVRKPAPPAGNPAPETGGEALAMTEQKPPEGASRAERASPQWEEPRALNPGAAAAVSPQIELIGLDQPAATRLFGPAAEHSEEPPATVWRYKSATCELDLFFYLDLRSGRMRTLHYALKGGGSDPAQRQDCLRSLLASRSG